MNAIEYTKTLRRVATVSWVGSLAVFLGLAWLRILPLDETLPLLALLGGVIPIAVFMLKNKATCESCGGQMKISSGFPRIIFRCKTCGAEINTGIHSDY